MKKNLDLRQAIEKSGLYYWQIADALGVSDTTFSKRLRKELSVKEKEEVYDIIKHLRRENASKQ